MDFMTTKEAALKWGLTNRMVQYYCKEGKIQKAEKIDESHSAAVFLFHILNMYLKISKVKYTIPLFQFTFIR
mgnify:CR=1 FL=1